MNYLINSIKNKTILKNYIIVFTINIFPRYTFQLYTHSIIRCFVDNNSEGLLLIFNNK